MSPGDARKKGGIEIIADRLGKEKQYHNFGFSHDTDTITVKQSRSSYSTLVTLTEKLDRQIEIAQKINAVNPDDVVKSVLKTHLLPDIIGNTKAFTSQTFRCKSCSMKFRRMPVLGVCHSCGGELQPSVTRGSVQKYLQLGLRLSEKYNVGEYLRSRFVLASEELATLFPPEGHQSDINDYFGETREEPHFAVERPPVVEVKAQENFTLVDSTEESKKPKRARQKAMGQYQTTLF